MYVVVFDNGDPDRVELIGPFASSGAATDWGSAALEPLGAAWVVEPLFHPGNAPTKHYT